jgi:hypothetical protein
MPARLFAYADLVNDYYLFVDLVAFGGGTQMIDELDYRAQVTGLKPGTYQVFIRYTSSPGVSPTREILSGRLEVPR